MKSLKILFPLFIFWLISSYAVHALYLLQKDKPLVTLQSSVQMPKSLTKFFSLEFSGITSDYYMLQTLVFLGQKIFEKSALNKKEYDLVYDSLLLITFLDPKFIDPYILAETTLPWEANMVDETNALLKKGASEIPNDWRLNFFLWYNYYYFKHDPVQAAPFLQKASDNPSAPKYFKTLAARMYLFAGQFEAAITFLKITIHETTNEDIKRSLETRLDAIEKIYFLEKKVSEFRKKYKSNPINLDELVKRGLISSIPVDPYNGKFYITPEGRVYTTSKLAFSSRPH